MSQAKIVRGQITHALRPGLAEVHLEQLKQALAKLDDEDLRVLAMGIGDLQRRTRHESREENQSQGREEGLRRAQHFASDVVARGTFTFEDVMMGLDELKAKEAAARNALPGVKS